MSDDSTFFPSRDSVIIYPGQTCEPMLIHSSESGWTQIWRVDKDGRFRTIKALKPEYRGQVKFESLLRKEYEIGYSLSHTAIREIYDFRDIPGFGNCIEMEWIDGVTLTEFLSGGIDNPTARRIALQLCDALGYLHSKQIVHRDIKPSNILITHNGNYVKLIDFGFSDTDSFSILKGPGGTASFAAPELLAGEAVDNRSDIWSLGKVISLLLPNEKSIIRKCVQPDPDKRFQDVGDIKEALLRKRRVWPLVAAVAVVVAGVFIARQSRQSEGSQEALGTFPAVEDTTDIVDVGAIDELFRQVTEMIDDAGSQ